MNRNGKISKFFSRLVLVVVYCAFFTVQLTAYFSHATGSIYRLNSKVFHATASAKKIQDGFSEKDGAAKKISIRLNKKFFHQAAVLYTVFVHSVPDFSNTQITPAHYPDLVIIPVFLLDHPLRGPPAIA